MEARVTAVLIDERGWQKTFDLTEGVYWVGSAASAHIRLADGDQIPPYLLQIVNRNAEPSVRVINLSMQEVMLQKGSDTALLAPRHMVDAYGPEVFHACGFTLQFKLEKQGVAQPVTGETHQQLIGLRLVLSDVVLRPSLPLDGVLTLQNLGTRACQFRVSIEGLPAACLELSPPPLIHPGGEESTRFRIYHRQTSPPAGPCRMVLRVSAPDVYPGAEVTLHQILQVAPVYAHSIAFEPVAARLAGARLAGAQMAGAHEPERPANGGAPVHPAPIGVTQPATAPQVPSAVPGTGIDGPLVEAPLVPSDDEDDGWEPAPPVAAHGDPTWGAPVIGLEEPAGLSTDFETAPAADPESLVFEPGDPGEVSLPQRRSRRPDLGSVKVIQANNGDFLQKRTDQE